jgi:hypothetical protein
MTKNIMLTQADQRTMNVLSKLVGGEIKVKEAMRLLGLSKRQVLRKKKAYLKDGVASIPHASRGETTGKGVSEKVKSKIIYLLSGYGVLFKID